MSGFKQHALTGLAAGSVVTIAVSYLSTNVTVGLIFGFFTVVGAILPDIDVGSIPSRIFAIAAIIIACLFIWKGMDRHAAIVGILNAVMRIDKHRGMMHSIVLIVACLVVGGLGCVGKIHVYYSVLAPLSFGMFVHIILVDREY